jgi:signal recognition particle subunit SEC65
MKIAVFLGPIDELDYQMFNAVKPSANQCFLCYPFVPDEDEVAAGVNFEGLRHQEYRSGGGIYMLWRDAAVPKLSITNEQQEEIRDAIKRVKLEYNPAGYEVLTISDFTSDLPVIPQLSDSDPPVMSQLSDRMHVSAYLPVGLAPMTPKQERLYGPSPTNFMVCRNSMSDRYKNQMIKNHKMEYIYGKGYHFTGHPENEIYSISDFGEKLQLWRLGDTLLTHGQEVDIEKVIRQAKRHTAHPVARMEMKDSYTLATFFEPLRTEVLDFDRGPDAHRRTKMSFIVWHPEFDHDITSPNRSSKIIMQSVQEIFTQEFQDVVVSKLEFKLTTDDTQTFPTGFGESHCIITFKALKTTHRISVKVDISSHLYQSSAVTSSAFTHIEIHSAGFTE